MYSCVWIGLHFDVAQRNNQLYWSDGSSVTFTNWRSNGDSSDKNDYVCVSYEKDSSLWVNDSCSSECSFVCKQKGRLN